MLRYFESLWLFCFMFLQPIFIHMIHQILDP